MLIVPLVDFVDYRRTHEPEITVSPRDSRPLSSLSTNVDVQVKGPFVVVTVNVSAAKAGAAAITAISAVTVRTEIVRLNVLAPFFGGLPRAPLALTSSESLVGEAGSDHPQKW